jgi:hypothetical protein
MLFVSIVLMVVGYTMLYSSMHGNWEFWTYFFPKNAPPAANAPTAPTAPAAA